MVSLRLSATSRTSSKVNGRGGRRGGLCAAAGPAAKTKRPKIANQSRRQDISQRIVTDLLAGGTRRTRSVGKSGVTRQGRSDGFGRLILLSPPCWDALWSGPVPHQLFLFPRAGTVPLRIPWLR